MNSNTILIFLIIGCSIILLLQIFSIKFKTFFTLCLNCFLSILGFNIVNYAIASFGLGIELGINAITLSFSTFLGLPGFITLYAIQVLV